MRRTSQVSSSTRMPVPASTMPSSAARWPSSSLERLWLAMTASSAETPGAGDAPPTPCTSATWGSAVLAAVTSGVPLAMSTVLLASGDGPTVIAETPAVPAEGLGRVPRIRTAGSARCRTCRPPAGCRRTAQRWSWAGGVRSLSRRQLMVRRPRWVPASGGCSGPWRWGRRPQARCRWPGWRLRAGAGPTPRGDASQRPSRSRTPPRAASAWAGVSRKSRGRAGATETAVAWVMAAMSAARAAQSWQPCEQ